MLPRDNPRQEIFLLGHAAECHQHRRDHFHRERNLGRSAGGGALFLENVLLEDTPVGASEAAGPHPGAPTAAIQDPLPAQHVVLFQAPPGADLVTDLLGYLGPCKSADFGAKRLFLGTEIQMHEVVSPRWERAACS